jgi:nucleoside-diphosphate-sugar epimerase
LLEFEKLNSYTWPFFDHHAALPKLASTIGDKHYFITGGSGLFGSWVISFMDWCHVRKLASPKITALVRQNILPIRDYITPCLGTIESFQQSSKFDRLIHLAAPSARDTFSGMSDRDKLQQIYLGTKNVLDFASEQVFGRCLFASSGAVYGGFPADYSTPITELNRYAPLPTDSGIGLGLGKRVAEFLVEDYCRTGAVNAGIARCFSFVGPGLPTNLHYAVGNFVHAAVEGRDILINGDGKPIRSFMYLGDLLYWLLTILEYGEPGGDFNVGSAEAISIANLAFLARECLNPNIKIVVKGNDNTTPGNPINSYYVPDLTKFKSSFDCGSLVCLRDAIRIYGHSLGSRHPKIADIVD